MPFARSRVVDLRWSRRTVALLAAFGVWRFLLLLRPSAERIGRSPNLEGRTYIWHVVRQFIDRRPIGGWGLNAVWTQPDIHYAFLNFGGGGYDVNEAHNGFYEVLLAGGVLGLLGLAFCLLSALWIAARYAVVAPGPLGYVPLFTVGYITAVNLTESYVGANLLPWWLLLAIVTGAVSELTPPLASDPSRDRDAAARVLLSDGVSNALRWRSRRRLRPHGRSRDGDVVCPRQLPPRPTAGLFISAASLVAKLGKVYLYCNGNPTTWSNPSGIGSVFEVGSARKEDGQRPAFANISWSGRS